MMPAACRLFTSLFTAFGSTSLTPDALELVRAIQKREDARTKRKVTAATGNGKQLRLGLGVNVVAALQRNERLGRSWRGSWEVG